MKLRLKDICLFGLCIVALKGAQKAGIYPFNNTERKADSTIVEPIKSDSIKVVPLKPDSIKVTKDTLILPTEISANAKKLINIAAKQTYKSVSRI